MADLNIKVNRVTNQISEEEKELQIDKVYREEMLNKLKAIRNELGEH